MIAFVLLSLFEHTDIAGRVLMMHIHVYVTVFILWSIGIAWARVLPYHRVDGWMGLSKLRSLEA